MKPINFSFGVKNNKYQQTTKTQNKTTPIEYTSQTATNEYKKVNCSFLNAYNNVVSFKGNETETQDKATTLINTLNLIKFKKLKESFKEFNNPNNWNNFINNICRGYSEQEIEEILGTIISLGGSACGKFSILTNLTQKEEIKYSGDSSFHNFIVLKRALTPSEAKDVIINEITKNSDVETYIELRDREYSSEIATNIIKYGIKNDDIPRLKKLLELTINEQKLTQDEALTCLAYEFDKTEKVEDFVQRLKKDYAGNKLDLFDAALCTVQELNDEQTIRFLELKSKQISFIKEDGNDDIYTLSTQEAVLCAKAELTNDELRRYVALKSKPFIYTSVREHNQIKTLSTELIIAYIKDKQSDEEIEQLAKFGFKDSYEYDDFKNILKFFGYESIKKAPDKIQKTISYIAKLQNQNGHNIFKDIQGQFNFDEFDIDTLHHIAAHKLTPEQTKDYSEILTNLSKIPNIDKVDLKFIAIPLAKLPNNTKIFFKNCDNIYFPTTNILELFATMRPQLTSKQIQDYISILQILEKKQNPHNIDLDTLALQLASLSDKIKNSFKNQNDELSIDSYSLSALNIIARYELDLSQFEDFSTITSAIKKQMPFFSTKYIIPISVFVAKLPNETKCKFKNSEGKFEFTKEDLIEFETIINHAPDSNIYKDYHSILSVLKKQMPNISDKQIRKISINIAILPERIKKTFKNEQGEFCFDGLGLEELETIYTYELTLDEYKDFSKIIPAIKTAANNEEENEEINISEVSSEFAKLTIEKKNSYKNQEGEFCFDGFSLEELETISDYNLSQSQFKDYSKISSSIEQSGKNSPQHIIADIAKLKDEVKETLKDDSGKYKFDKLDEDDFKVLSNFTPSQCENYLYLRNILGFEIKKAIHIATNEDLMQRFRLVNPDIFWKGATGESREIFEIFDSMLSAKETNTTPLRKNDFDIVLPQEFIFEDGNLTFTSNDSQENFCVQLSKTQEKTPILVIKNNNKKQESYIAYDGAIALFRELDILTPEQTGKLKESLSSHAHFSIEELNALTEAARHLFINIIENNGECIISKGINNIDNAEAFEGKSLETETTKQKFDSVLQSLHSLGEINVENILKLMPKDAIIQIRPYATSSSSNPILYSISAEWEDKNGIAWQFRTHSDDLKYPNSEHNWIYRLGYRENGEEKFYDNKEQDINNRFKNGRDNPTETHIWLDKEPQIFENKYKDYLISNPNFQTIIRNISISFNKNQQIKDIAKELGINDAGNRPYDEISNEVLQKCQQKAGFYYKYKKVIDYILMEKGLPSLDKTTEYE